MKTPTFCCCCTHMTVVSFSWFALCVSDPLAAGGWDRFSPASLLGHQLGHTAQSGRACFALQRSTALSLRRCPAAVCLRAWAVSGKIQRGKDTHARTHARKSDSITLTRVLIASTVWNVFSREENKDNISLSKSISFMKTVNLKWCPLSHYSYS